MKRIFSLLFLIGAVSISCTSAFATPETIGTAGSPWTSDAIGSADGYFINNGGTAYTLDVTAGFPDIYTGNLGGPYTNPAVGTNNASLSNIVFSSNLTSQVYGTIGTGAAFADITMTGTTSVDFYGTVNTTTMHVAIGTANFLSGTNSNNAAVTFTGDGTVSLAANTQVTGAAITNTANTGTMSLTSGSEWNGAVGGATGIKAINVVGGNSSAGISATVSGALDTYSISLLTNTLNVGGSLTMANGGTGTVIDTTVASNSVYGNIVATGAISLGTGVIDETLLGSATMIPADEIVVGLVAPVTVISNSPSGATTINNGSLQVSSPSALGSGPVVNDATLSIGTTSVILNNTYTQSSGSSLDLTADSSSNFGNISTTSHAAVVSAGSTVNVTIGGYIPNNATLEIINTGGTGIGSAPATVNAIESGDGVYSSRVGFSSSIVGNNLILTANRSNDGFASLANNANARSAGNVLDNETNPSSDLANVLNTLEFSSNAQTTSALNSLAPIVDGGILESNTASLNNFIGASLERAQDVLTTASTGNSNSTGVSSGDENPLNALWAKQYGGYLDQGTRDGIEGYNAWNTGTAVGLDHLFTDNLTIGASLGYAYAQVNSDINNASTDINSAEATLYAAYQGQAHPYFIDAAGSFANNWYDGQRAITVNTINRIADANYQGQQSGIYLDGGYKFDVGSHLKFTPLASLQWTHLAIDNYTESNAGALDLMVNRQSYNILESGLGASIAYPVKFGWGDVTPEVHAKWLYDFIDDNMVVTSAFTGGGASFTSTGASPARNGANIGGKLSFDFNNDISLIAGIDTEVKDNFFGVYGSVALRYKF